ncbi:hypothetical protein Pdw03_4978 [Penicillium digitatum]|uniref:Uncharacterized protein n=1 Tax=Penicillium digitatum TaxID=36651 RepID=A0A7T7BJJ3_PENDI|nr:hypothetical protein Pdw03_4978 [Penicillium digitatum]
MPWLAVAITTQELAVAPITIIPVVGTVAITLAVEVAAAIHAAEVAAIQVVELMLSGLSSDLETLNARTTLSGYPAVHSSHEDSILF